jgi:hypothetical protein
MKKMMIVLSCLLTAYNSMAYAKCKRAEVAGKWVIYFGVGFASRCTLISPRAGSTSVASGSYCYIPGVVSSIPLTGDLLLSSDCHVIGQFVINNTALNMDGWISKDKETISGMSWNPANGVGGIFTGVKI